MDTPKKVLIERITVPFYSIEVGEIRYSKDDLEAVPFSLYHEITDLPWLKDKQYSIIRNTQVHHSSNEWMGTEFVVSYYIEFCNEKDAFEFSIRYEKHYD